MLVVFKSAPILKRALKVKQAMMQLYVLKLLKVQTKYLGRQWRKSNMKTMSAIYQKVRHRLNDDWAYGNGKYGHALLNLYKKSNLTTRQQIHLENSHDIDVFLFMRPLMQARNMKPCIIVFSNFESLKSINTVSIVKHYKCVCRCRVLRKNKLPI